MHSLALGLTLPLVRLHSSPEEDCYKKSKYWEVLNTICCQLPSVHRDDAPRPQKTMDTHWMKRSRLSSLPNTEEAVSPTTNVGSPSTEPQPRASRSDTITLTLSLNHLANKVPQKTSTLDGLVYLPNGSAMSYEYLIRCAMDY